MTRCESYPLCSGTIYFPTAPFLTQPGKSARLITFHTKKPCAPKKAQGVSRGDAAQASPLGFSYRLSKR